MRWFVASLWLLLAACGGGGRGGEAPPPPVVTGQFIEGQAAANSDDTRSPPIRSLVTVRQVDQLAGLVPSPPVEYLISALNDADPSIREDAIEALGDRGDPEGVSGLWRALYSDYDWLKLSAIEALADIGTDEAEVREAVVDALADIGTDAARGYLDQALSDSDSNVRATASEALAELFHE